MVQNQNIFQAYKPLRNNLRKLCLDDSFFVIWNFVQHLQFGKEIDKTIEVNPALMYSKDTKSWRPNEWELELLAKEIIINSQDIYSSPKSLKKWSYFSGAYSGVSGRQFRRHPDIKPEHPDILSIQFLLTLFLINNYTLVYIKLKDLKEFNLKSFTIFPIRFYTIIVYS